VGAAAAEGCAWDDSAESRTGVEWGMGCRGERTMRAGTLAESRATLGGMAAAEDLCVGQFDSAESRTGVEWGMGCRGERTVRAGTLAESRAALGGTGAAEELCVGRFDSAESRRR
jgi:hypothetical protein